MMEVQKMIAILDRFYMNPDEYLEWEARQELKHEYIDGEVYAMTGGTIPHNAIAINLIAALRPHVRDSGCRVLGSDAKVRITEKGPFLYSDVLVTCDERDKQAIQAIEFPTLIIEVLSPETEAYDRGHKFSQYRRLSSLQEYVLINSDRIGADIFRLNERGKWELTPYTIDDEIELIGIGFKCSIAFYRKIGSKAPSF
jgi:Uma2 family endonuclease